MGESALGIVKEACKRMGQLQPGQLVTSQDSGVTQFWGLLNGVGRELSKRFKWHEQHKRVTWNSPGTEEQGAVSTLLGAEAEELVGCTLWDATLNVPLRGAIPMIEVQEKINFGWVGPVPEYAMYDGKIFIYPAPAAGRPFNAFIRTKNWVISSSVPKDRVHTDADTMIFDDELLTVGLMYFWKREKGLAYAEDQRTYEEMASNLAAINKPRVTIHLDGGGEKTGMYVPSVP